LIRVAIRFSLCGDTGKDERGLQPCLQTGDDVGVHAVPDHDRRLRVGVAVLRAVRIISGLGLPTK
jgi:hypothetical protein